MPTTLVTGGCGFVGQAIARALLDRGEDVVILDRAPSCPVEGARYLRVDITARDAVIEACAGVDAIIHNASLVHTKQNHGALVWAVNFEGTRHMLDAARAHGISRLLYISSGSVVYEGEDIEDGDERLPYCSRPQAPYADSKIAAEKLVLDQNGVDGLSTCALRPHVIFGPGDGRFMPAVLAQARAGRLKVQVGRGTWLSDYTYIDNLVDAVVLAHDALAHDGQASVAAGQAYFITNGEPIPFWDFVSAVLAELGYPPIRYKVPAKLVYAIAAIKETVERFKGDVITPEDGLTRFAIRYMCTHHYFSIAKARRELGYDPAVSIREGIARTCAHLRATGVA